MSQVVNSVIKSIHHPIQSRHFGTGRSKRAFEIRIKRWIKILNTIIYRVVGILFKPCVCEPLHDFFFGFGFEGVVAVIDVPKRPDSLFSIFMTVPQPTGKNLRKDLRESARIKQERSWARRYICYRFMSVERCSLRVTNLASCRGLTNAEIPLIFSLHVVGYSFDSSM